ncbi:mechanosensitive ion channel domain-containing protein [Nitratiruptor sp. YY09-18]|uniref:mechanosensitive ion channel domain-containing protein n=1 Tax=Nitratiruptor sp. YY09-18 TaxID=2724901 RepID=UPI0019166637|nr:mechanosensitive ion channel domain-containing protein [Nitratiruptor sp. YY09-18]BCD68282.1 hypothetical protein NitYY0918_C1193 [Nitratiruptor sp. YY09-18]
MLRVFLALFTFLILGFAEENITLQKQKQEEIEVQKRAQIALYNDELKSVDEKLSKNIWIKRYENYKTYYQIQKELKELEKKIGKIKKRKKKRELQDYQAKLETLKSQLTLLNEYKESPFVEVLKPHPIEKAPEIKNPFKIISALSYIKKIKSYKEYYKQKLVDLQAALKLLEEKNTLLLKEYRLTKDPKLRKEIDELTQEIKEFKEALRIAQETLSVYTRKIEENILKTTEEIKLQSQKAATIGAIILGLFILTLILKWMIRRYIQDNQRAYMANKIVNFNFAILIILILLFAYIENVSYLVTILGFASAGIAIAMKDMFMSLLGWMVIVVGGSIHVGDRIKVTKEGRDFVGDVIDISLLRITILEDVTLTSYLHNIRSGRVIFVPNNYIFTDLIANYTHLGLKTVWDSINFNITFDSNYKKAAHIAREIARKYAKGYTDIARKQLNKLRSTYHLKNTNVDVRVYTFAEEYGIRVSLWYMTNSYATLTLRSTISAEIIERYLAEPDITITYPAQKIFLTKDQSSATKPPENIYEVEA